MSAFYWFRVTMMIVALVGVVMTIKVLNEPNYPGKKNPLLAWFGADRSHIAEVNLCPTRVTRLEAPGRVAVFQEGMEWYREGAASGGGEAKTHLDPVAVEKWFSRNCGIEGTKVSASADVSEALKVHFVQGHPLTLLKSAGGEFEWVGRAFSSDHMTKAISELETLPEAKKH